MRHWTTLLVAIGALAAGGCETESEAEQALEETGEAVEEAGEQMRDAAEEAGDRVREAAEKVEEETDNPRR